MGKEQAIDSRFTTLLVGRSFPVDTLLRRYWLWIFQVLLDNKAYLSKRYSVPILVISYTNSALDQFLEKMLIFNQNIVRVGDQSKSEMLKPYLLSEIKERAKAMGMPMRNVEICGKADIIGMTTSGAARKKELLQVLQPKIG